MRDTVEPDGKVWEQYLEERDQYLQFLLLP